MVNFTIINGFIGTSPNMMWNYTFLKQHKNWVDLQYCTCLKCTNKWEKNGHGLSVALSSIQYLHPFILLLIGFDDGWRMLKLFTKIHFSVCEIHSNTYLVSLYVKYFKLDAQCYAFLYFISPGRIISCIFNVLFKFNLGVSQHFCTVLYLRNTL